MSRDEIIKRLNDLADEISPDMDASPTAHFVAVSLDMLAAFVELAAERQVADKLLADYSKFSKTNIAYERWLKNG